MIPAKIERAFIHLRSHLFIMLFCNLSFIHTTKMINVFKTISAFALRNKNQKSKETKA